MPSNDAPTRANSHQWVVTLTMPVRLILSPEGEVTMVAPAGMPALDQLGTPCCALCGAGDFDVMCPGAPAKGPMGEPGSWLNPEPDEYDRRDDAPRPTFIPGDDQ